MWPALIFGSLVALVLLDFWWHKRRLRRERDFAQREFTATSLRQQQQAYAQAQAQQQALFNSMVEGVLLLDQAGKIKLANQSLTRLLNLTADVRDRTISEAFRWPALINLAARVATEKQVLGVEFESPDAEPRCLQVNGSIYLDQQGQPQGTILVFHDITRIRQLENTRREFVANVSHELRTPLSLIKGFVETLLAGARNDPEVATRFLQKIETHADRLTFLIEDLLTISKLESGQTVMNLQRVPLREAVERAIADLESRVAEKKIVIENLVSEDLFAQADGERLQQVLFNLIENAIKYGASQGQVRIGGRELPEGQIEISVSDDGPGIPPEARDRIFERFFRVDKARSRETGGTGLGLAIVKHIVLAHGGKVWVESEPGRGASFYFTLPKA